MTAMVGLAGRRAGKGYVAANWRSPQTSVAAVSRVVTGVGLFQAQNFRADACLRRSRGRQVKVHLPGVTRTGGR
jgi:hypothetical protein